MMLSLEAIFREAEQLLKKNSIYQTISLFKKIIHLENWHKLEIKYQVPFWVCINFMKER